MSRPIQHLGFGGRSRVIESDIDLGRGRLRIDPNRHGFRMAVWDAAFGYVSGFRVRDIAYYIATRSLSSRVQTWALAREAHLGYYDQNPQPINLPEDLDGCHSVSFVGETGIRCPVCEEEIAVPVWAGIRADEDGETEELLTAAEYTDLWAHAWVHEQDDDK